MPSQWNQVAAETTRMTTPMVQVIMPYLKLSATEYWFVEKRMTLGLPLIGRPTTQSMQSAAGSAKAMRVPAERLGERDDDRQHDQRAHRLRRGEQVAVHHHGDDDGVGDAEGHAFEVDAAEEVPHAPLGGAGVVERQPAGVGAGAEDQQVPRDVGFRPLQHAPAREQHDDGAEQRRERRR